MSMPMKHRSRRRFMTLVATAATVAALPTAVPTASAKGKSSRKVEVFGHRGACALRPEHTLASYAQAIVDGADYIEPDLVCTRDGVLVARHENNLTETTDVSLRPEFSARRTGKTIDGVTEEGWFVEDFSLAELKRLRAIERIPAIRPGNTAYDGQFQVPTWDEIVEFVAAASATHGRAIGLIPELKHSTYFARIGLPLEDRFAQSLDAHSHTQTHPLEVQSFEVDNLRALRRRLGRRPNLRLMQLVGGGSMPLPADTIAAGQGPSYAQMLTPAGLREVASYADVVAPPSRLLIPWGPDQRLLAPTRVIADAHDAGLLVHTWTFRPENRFLPAEFRSSAGDNTRHEAGSMAEIRAYVDAGIDGFFTDDPAVGVAALRR
jgi:glycerophosphoryl diester phosphodiesterase